MCLNKQTIILWNPFKFSIPTKSNASADNKTPTIKRMIQTKQWALTECLNNTGVRYEELFSNINRNIHYKCLGKGTQYYRINN